MKKILSIVVPAYNTEKLIEKCLESLVIRNDLMNQIEVLVVNDGSMDNTTMVAEKFVNRYPNVFRLFNKSNGGHGSAINMGISKATGQYIKILDSDDWFDSEVFEEYVCDLLHMRTVDVIINNLVYCNDVSGNRRWNESLVTNDLNGKEVRFDDVIENNYIGMSMVTFRLDIIKVNKIIIDENLYYSDVEYMHFIIPYVNTCYCTDYYLYYYRINQKTQSCSISGFKKHSEDHRRIIEKCIERFHSIKSTSEKEKYLLNRIVDLSVVQYRIYLSNLYDYRSRKQLNKFDRFLFKEDREVYYLCEKYSFIKSYRENKVSLLSQIRYVIGEIQGEYDPVGY